MIKIKPTIKRLTTTGILALLCLYGGKSVAQTAILPIQITADARAPWKRHIPVKVTISGCSGPQMLAFPHWLPGMHAPQGTLGSFGKLHAAVDGLTVDWNRDPFDPYLVRIVIPPAGSHTLVVDYEYIATGQSDEVFFGVAADENMAVINPSAFSLAPVGSPAKIPVQLSVRIPKHWKPSSAMLFTHSDDPDSTLVSFSTVSLYTMIDSPMMAGKYKRTIPLATTAEDVPHTLDLYADSEEVLKAKAPALTTMMNRLVAESQHLFGVRHYPSFHYMLGLTTEIGRNGLEHHAGVAYILEPNDLDEATRATPLNSWNSMLIPHEFTHSWNGKYRRPYGEDVATNVAPQSADLIWVYEGLTEYLGDVLMVRSGFRPAASWRNDLLRELAGMRFGEGRNWESLADTAIVAPFTYTQGAGAALRSINDVYYESELAWMEADAIIRTESHGTKSLDDFCRLFFGGANRGAEIVPYHRKDVVEALNSTLKYDWDGFIKKRFYSAPGGLPVDGLTAAGWKFGFADKPSTPGRGVLDFRFSVGAEIGRDGKLYFIVKGSSAERAGLETGMTVLGVNGSIYSADVLSDALKGTKGGKGTLELLISHKGKYKAVKLELLDGEKYPTLTRIADKPDLFAAITASTTPTADKK